MSTIDLESLLAQISPEDPCGSDLEYDAEMRELDQAAQGKAEQQMGDTIVAAQEPDWRDVKKRSVALLARSKDLRVASLLTESLLHTENFDGFADGLAVMHGLMERHWAPLHPRLDPDDDNDPTMRINIVLGLVDPTSFLNPVRSTPFVNSQGFGRFSLRELAFATGEAQPPTGETAPSMSTIEGAFQASSLEAITATVTAVEACIANVKSLEATLTAHVGSSNAPSLEPLRRILHQVGKLVREKLSARTTVESPAAETPGIDSATASVVGSSSGRALAGDIRSRQDVVRALDKIVEYYERQEPSSPVPILVKRCKRLVTASFEEIVKNLIPDAMNQLEGIKGPADSEGN